MVLWCALTGFGQESGGFPKITHFFSSEVNRSGVRKMARNHLMVDGSDAYGLFYTVGNGTLIAVRNKNPDFTGLFASNLAFVNENDPMLVHPDFDESYLVHYYNPSLTCHYSNRVYVAGYSGTNRVCFYNLADEEAWAFRLNYLNDKYNEVEAESPDFYDGFYLDGALSYPIFFYTASGPFDLDCNGQLTPYDGLELTLERWKSHYLDFFIHLRTSMPEIRLLCNDLPEPVNDYTMLLNHVNGTVSELQLWDYYQRGAAASDWYEQIVHRMLTWNSQGMQPPVSTLIMIYDTTDQGHSIAQAQNDYKRMRFGLTTALIAGVSFTYANSPKWYDTLCFWNDEYDNAGRMLPGYLGQPEGLPFRYDSAAVNGEIVVNGDFDNGLTGWDPWIQPDACSGAPAGTVVADYSEYYSAPAAARITPSCVAAQEWNLQLVQNNLQGIQPGKRYLLTFMAKASTDRTIRVEVGRINPFSTVGLYQLENISSQWSEHRIVFETSNNFIPGTDVIRLLFHAGHQTGTVWIDDVSLITPRPGIWARTYEEGLVICNPTDNDTVIQLSQAMYHIAGINETIINNGQMCTSVNIAARDGIVLLTAPTPQVPVLVIDTDTIEVVHGGVHNLHVTNQSESPLHWIVDHENLLKDGGLEDDFECWRHESEHNWQYGYRGYTGVELEDPASVMQCMVMMPDQQPTMTCYTRLFQANLPLVAGGQYLLHFRAKGTFGGELFVTVGNSCGYDPMFSATVNTSSEWESHIYSFINTSGSSPTLFFGPGKFDWASVDAVWLMPLSAGPYPAFLTFDTLKGDLQAGATRWIQLSFDSTGLEPGVYQGRIMLTSNTVTPAVYIPYRFTVEEPIGLNEPPQKISSQISLTYCDGQLLIQPGGQSANVNKLYLYNCCGQLVFSILNAGTYTPLPIPKLPPGVYVATIQQNRIWQRVKLVVVE